MPQGVLVSQPSARPDDPRTSIMDWRACSRSAVSTATFRSVTEEPDPDPQHGPSIQRRASIARAGFRRSTMSNWPQWVSTIKPPEGDELAKGTYRPLLAPVNFDQSKKGTQYPTVWYSGPLSIRNMRGRFEFIPSNLQRFTG